MKKYDHVIVIGVDGGGAFFEEADTPNFDRIFGSGAVTYRALASFPSISAECWGSMLLGVSPKIHGLTNDIISKIPYSEETEFPSLFKRIRKAYPNAEMGSFCDWDPITRGIVERSLDVRRETARDRELTPMICDYILQKKPDFLFVQMDSVDGAGHRNGYGTQGHLDQIHTVDGYLGEVYEAVEKAGIADSTFFCMICDHGGKNSMREDGSISGSHGGWEATERYITFAAKGKTVARGRIGKMNVRDLSAIVLSCLDIPIPVFDLKGWTSQIPQGLFEDMDAADYRDVSGEEGAPPRVSDEHHKTKWI